MDTLTQDNHDQAIIPPKFEAMMADVSQLTDRLVKAAFGLGGGDEMPVWYVMIKLAGHSGIPLQTLYDDPMTRQHALAAFNADSTAKLQIQAIADKQARERG